MSDKPADCRCDFCWNDGSCDKVAVNLGWCAAVKLAVAVTSASPAAGSS